MTDTPDTSPEAVEQIAQAYDDPNITDPLHLPNLTAATLRAQAAERDALKAELAEAKMLLSHMVNHAEWLEKNEYFFWEATDKVRAFLTRHQKDSDG